MKRIDIVCYTSKLCNLRCRYCYELPLLSDRRRMSLGQIERMFWNFASYFGQLEDPPEVRFQWHGGEPLLIPPDFYWRILELERRVFDGTGCPVRNVVQSNMTVLDDERIELLRDGFDVVGISLDLFSGLRVNQSGECQEERGIRNLDRALAAGVKVNGITVLTRPLLVQIADVYRFWRDREMNFRLLPIEKGMYEPGQGFEVDAHETLDALCEVADLWFADDRPVSIQPLMRHLRLLMYDRSSGYRRVPRYDKSRWEGVVLVDTDGAIYSYTNRFDSARSPGNIFDVGFGQILAGRTHARVVAEANARMAATCSSCAYWGRSCPGDPIAEGEMNFTERTPDGALDCVVTKGLIRHLERRLRQAGVIDPTSGLLSESFTSSAYAEVV